MPTIILSISYLIEACLHVVIYTLATWKYFLKIEKTLERECEVKIAEINFILNIDLIIYQSEEEKEKN
jgi:hypothetical protein